MAKPSVNLKPVAGNYAAPNERIIEFSNGRKSMDALKGGLISIRTLDDGSVVVDVYRLDEGVTVNVEQKNTEKPPAQ